MHPGTCSTSTTSLRRQEEKTNVLIHYPITDPLTEDVKFKFIRLSVDELIKPNGEKPVYRYLNDSFLTSQTNCAYTLGSRSGLCLHLFSCHAEPDATTYTHFLYKAYRYNISESLKHADIDECRDMPRGMGSSLVVKVDDHIYLLGYVDGPKYIFAGNDRLLEPLFQRYNIKGNYWDVVKNSSSALIKVHTRDKFVHGTINRAPHVVIGSKLHLSLGESSFTFDTSKGVWEKCKLFETFWLNQENRNTDLSLYGGRCSFGFSGKGILYGEDILLGVNYAPNCPLVAFRLDGSDGDRVVVQSQCITTNELALPNELGFSSARLIDLGRDCYFGLVHFVYHDKPYDMDLSPRDMELTVFRVERVEVMLIGSSNVIS